MNPEADPCTDFAEFACGNFYKTATFNEGETRTSPFTALGEKNNKIIKERIEAIGVEPYLKTSYAKEWPTLIGQNWTGEPQFDLNDVITRYFGVFIDPIVSFSLSLDPMNSSRYAIFLDDPGLFLPRTYFIRPRNDPLLMAYERYLRDTAIYLGAEPDVAAEDAADVLDLEIKLSERSGASPSPKPSTSDSKRHTLSRHARP
ncbi:endothelin-converting enzyme 1 [Plakobranchus ocellatus]|uniref:Endothelin-converting enzyme 1 n=1 Tax=Plakobranchus ocellatus TaxID=259542 RepID=A0AAV4CPK4_9GAST|nr:endothelin-converting enzyme 1 [Plakobranchus ocellatus]